MPTSAPIITSNLATVKSAMMATVTPLMAAICADLSFVAMGVWIMEKTVMMAISMMEMIALLIVGLSVGMVLLMRANNARI